MKGFTLLEMLLVVTLIIIIATFSFASLSSLNTAQALDKDVKGIVAIIDEARSNTLTSQNDSQYGVHFESEKVVLFRGTTYSASDSNNRDAGLSGVTTISTISLTGGASDIVFARLTGAANATGTVVVRSKRDSSKTKTITIHGTGIIAVQ